MKFKAIYNNDGTCGICPRRRVGMILAYDGFSPEAATWFCEDCWPGYQGLMTVVRDKRQYLLASPKPFDSVAFQFALAECAHGIKTFFDSISSAFAEVVKVVRRMWDNLRSAVRRALTIIKKSEVIKSKPRAHRKRINQRRLHVYQRNAGLL